MKGFLTFKAAKRHYDSLQHSRIWESSHNEIRFKHKDSYYRVSYIRQH